MRQAIKNSSSEILKQNLKYIQGNSNNNKKIADILFDEQKKFCAYTDEYISRTDAKDIEHFNPELKGTLSDSYDNWFLVKHQWNKEKSYKWKNYQPVIHPTSNDFENRVIYKDGDYIVNSETDIEAQNLISLLKLDDVALADKRKRYIARKLKEITVANQDYESYFSELIEDDPCNVSYLRAIKEEFRVDLWPMLK
ncbi:MAG TPA: HNH endonuclease domain-containing protein [Chitinophagaceae bacterium]|nr:HNH endonuclease domain-containing protein [Chitinophagaceae bacterium]